MELMEEKTQMKLKKVAFKLKGQLLEQIRNKIRKSTVKHQSFFIKEISETNLEEHTKNSDQNSTPFRKN